MKIASMICALVGHKYRAKKVFSSVCRKVYCPRCGCAWGMHDTVKALVAWDGDLEQLHKEGKR